MGFRFADVISTTRYDLPEIGPGVWIEVRNELTVGEKRRMFRDAIKGETPLGDGTVRIEYDQAKLSFATVVAYVTDWSQAHVPDKAERKPLTPSAIEALDEEHFRIIERVVEDHIRQKKLERTQSRTTDTPPATSPSTTPTPSDAATSFSVVG